MTSQNLPAVVATIGLHGSASTWVFNVVRELMIAAAGEDRVLALYADEVAQIPDETARAGRSLVVKSHHGSAGLDDWLREAGAPLFLSVRDPRDAAVSMAQRFKAPLDHAAEWLANDCERMTRLAAGGLTPLLRYEDRFFEHKAVIAQLAVRLGLQPSSETIDAVFDRYRTEAVRDFARSLPDLPPERLTMVGAFAMDKVTQILAPHIGDGVSGKWRTLPGLTRVRLTRRFRPFLQRFGYPD